MEDVTDPEVIRQNEKTDRSICLYGYIRGTHMKNNCQVHIAGGSFLWEHILIHHKFALFTKYVIT